MDNPEAERTTINVKNVKVSAWERAKRAANRNDETMGDWLSRACDMLADMEEGKREFGPGEPTRPRREMSPEQVGVLMEGLKSLAVATGKPVPKRSAAELMAVAVDMAREARGLPPKPLGAPPVKRAANPPLLNGKTGLIDQDQE